MEDAEKPLISIITVCFNAVDSIEKTIQSVLSQKYSKIEYIVVDGLSTDGTYEIVKKFSDKIHVIHEKDHGIYDAMNKGGLAATGEYVYFLNSGDILKTVDTISGMVHMLGTARPDMICCNVNYIYGSEKSVLRRYFKYRWLNMFCMAAGWSTCHQAVLCRTALFQKKCFDTSYVIWADQELFAYLIKKKCSVKYVDQVICDFDAYGFSYGRNNLQISREECDRINKQYHNLWRYFFYFPKWIVRKMYH